jgi:DNA polymerase-3 subunit delta'
VPGSTIESVFDAVVGQDSAIATLRALGPSPAHAYMFIGPSGCGKDVAARAFAAVKLQGTEDATTRVAGLVMRRMHVDVHELERDGASINVEQAREEIVKIADRTAVEGSTRVIVVHEFELMAGEARSTILKTLEEPDGRTVMILLGEDVPSEFTTIASRTVRVNFAPIPDEIVVRELVAAGHSIEAAERAAHIAAGDLERAMIVVNDPALASRLELFEALPGRLDGSHSTVVSLVTEILGAIETSLETYKAQQEAEVAALEERVKMLGERGSGRRALADRHKRELRRHRTDELRSGLRVLSLQYRDAVADLTESAAPHLVLGYADAVSRIRHANGALSRNVNERLLLEDLLMALPSLRER